MLCDQSSAANLKYSKQNTDFGSLLLEARWVVYPKFCDYS